MDEAVTSKTVVRVQEASRPCCEAAWVFALPLRGRRDMISPLDGAESLSKAVGSAARSAVAPAGHPAHNAVLEMGAGYFPMILTLQTLQLPSRVVAGRRRGGAGAGLHA